MQRDLIPLKRERSSEVFCFAAALAQILLLALGLCRAIAGGLSLPTENALLYGGIVALCVFFTVFFYGNWLTGARIYGAAAIVLVWAAIALFRQQAFLSGFRQLGCAVLEQMNESYGGDYMIPTVEPSGWGVSAFLLMCFVPVIAYLSASVVFRADILMTGLLVFPMLALLLLTGATPPFDACGCVLLGGLCVLSCDRVENRQTLWGERSSAQWNENRTRHSRIRAASAVLTCVLCTLLAVPSFVVLMPSLTAPIRQAQPFAAEMKGRLLQTFLSLLPDGIRGTHSPAQVVSGGVEDGSLHNSEGYLVSGVEDLRIRCSKKPEETLYLRGFIGGSYSDSRWLAPDSASFASAAANWQTEGDAEHYLYNLPFLRMIYEERKAGTESTAAELTVERINAGSRYTYTPYGGYLNEYYTITGGDGAVAGQTTQDDIFAFYFCADQTQTLDEEFFLQNESALDRLERMYAAFARAHYTELPQEFSRLQDACSDAEIDKSDIDEIVTYVQTYLRDNYRYDRTFPDIPEGEDVTLYFLYESKSGCSPHFASAATMMFRAFGIPARYVVGYAASKSLFSAQPDGSYQAVLQSDDAHAWVEIYISGVGWMPIETTPGALGMVQDTPLSGDDITPGPSETVQPLQPTDAPEPTAETQTPEQSRTPWVLVVVLVVTAAGAVAAVLLLRRRRRDLGLNRAVPPERRVQFIFAAYYRRLHWAGMPDSVESTSAEFAEWVKTIDPALGEETFARMMALALESCFGNQRSRESDVEWMRGVYCAAWGRIKRLPKKQRRKT